MGLDILRESKGVVDRRMRIARRDGVTDAEELELTLGIAVNGLRLTGNQPALRHFAEIDRCGLQLEVQIIERDRPVIDDHLIDCPLFRYATVVTANVTHQAIALLLDRPEPEGDSECDVQFLQGTHVRHEIHRHDFWRERPVRSHDFDFRTRVRDDLRGLEADVISGVVEDEHVSARLGVA